MYHNKYNLGILMIFHEGNFLLAVLLRCNFIRGKKNTRIDPAAWRRAGWTAGDFSYVILYFRTFFFSFGGVCTQIVMMCHR